MEKKKLLLVAVSVGVFLVIVVSAAILVFSPSGLPSAGTDWRTPSNAGAASDDSDSTPATTDPSALLNDQESRGLQSPPVTGNNVQENNIYINGETSEIAKNSGSTVINISRPQAAESPAIPAPKPPQQSPSAARSQNGQAVKKTTSAPPAKPPAAVPVPAEKKTGKDFWVQVGSYSNMERADNVRVNLGDKGITAIVTNQVVEGLVRYRVRIGPYTTRNEAEYWLKMVKSIDDKKVENYGNSMVMN